MKQKFITLAEAIANGLLRIFPRSVIVIVIVSILFIGCGTQKTVTQLVENVRIDTVYINRQQYDSIYIFQERTSDYHRGVIIPNPSDVQPSPLPDTIYIKDRSIEYRYRMLHDTLKVTERDSIPYEVTVTEVKEITRPRTWFDKLCLICFVVVTTSITLYVSRLIKGKQ